jgi:hypothetical protein
MTDPAWQTSGPPSGRQVNKVFLVAAGSDILTGVVLAAIGLSTDRQVLVVLGVALAVIGTAVTCWLIVRASRPEQI